ncbi:MAG: MmcQ/YjbR family DNA-binding protein [Bacteroidetes bacterium]|nr:MmcQ/YjbR family DNA-binding protein [Fibrella sp.]
MNIETLREYCLTKPGVTESFPFDAVTLVFKVGGKMFALADIEKQPLELALKCDPEKAVQLRETFDAVRPGFHLNKTHWNTVTADERLRDSQLREWIDDSYGLVYSRLTRTVKEGLK